jgi:hypothetical protein
MDAVLAAVAAAALNHHRNPPMARDLDPADHHVARRLRACSVSYMALGASLLLSAGDDRDHDRVVVGFLLWMAGTVLLLRRWPPASHRLRSRSSRLQLL